MKIAAQYLCLAIVFGGLFGLVWWVSSDQVPMNQPEKVEHVHAVGDSPHRDEIDPCAGLELPGKYVSTKVHDSTGKNLPYSTMILHFKGRISQGHRNCIGEVAGVENTWVPAMTRYQIAVTRAELYSWEDIKAGIENTLRWGTGSTSTHLLDYEDGGQPAQIDETNKEK